MTQLSRPTQFLQNDISRGRQDVRATFVFMRGTAKVRISICSDSYDFQCYARAELFSPTDLKWSVVSHIPYGEMKTKPKLCYYGPLGVARENFMADFDILLGIVDGLLSQPTFALVFADIPDGHPADEGLVGPLHFTGERDALLRFIQYIAPRVKESIPLVDAAITCCCLVGEEGAREHIEISPPEELLHLMSDSTTEQLRAFCDVYVDHRTESGAQAFYRLVPVTPA